MSRSVWKWRPARRCPPSGRRLDPLRQLVQRFAVPVDATGGPRPVRSDGSQFARAKFPQLGTGGANSPQIQVELHHHAIQLAVQSFLGASRARLPELALFG